MVNIDTLLNKTNPTGEDLGILDLAYISHNLKQVSEGRSNPEPLFPISEFNDKLQAFYGHQRGAGCIPALYRNS